ncbi:hypothetical protein HPB51_013786 [Rhipicephalus microplus]|uniref:Uncharacterized protein n=1 Tax=Rhipicephalus microplus TaxID=6941 RepID=A0A9J6F2U4_RHIMP|nr:hypothetical protein HPB51_013786 [Rhipicephalus microplus]
MSQPAPKKAAAPAPDEDIQAAWEMPLGEIGGGPSGARNAAQNPTAAAAGQDPNKGHLYTGLLGWRLFRRWHTRHPGATEAQLGRLRTHRYLRRTRGPAPVLSRLASNPVSINGGQHRGAYYEQRRGHRTPRQAPRCRQQPAAQEREPSGCECRASSHIYRCYHLGDARRGRPERAVCKQCWRRRCDVEGNRTAELERQPDP